MGSMAMAMPFLRVAPLGRQAEVGHVRLFVHLASDTVAAVLAHDAIALALDVRTDGVRYDADAHVGAGGERYRTISTSI